MPPKPTGSAKKTGTKHSRSLSDSDTGSTPAFKSRELPATVLSTDREVVDEWSAPEVPITTHDVTDSVVTVMIAHYVMLLAGRKTDGVTGCKYARWQDATDAIVGAVLMGLLETLGYVSKDLKYDDIVVKIHNKKTRSSNEAGPSSVKKENEDKYSQWDAVWGKFFTDQRRPSSWEKLIALALKFKEGILPDPRYFTVKSLFVTDAMAKHIDEGFQQLVADKDITLKAAILEFTKTFNVSFEEAQSAHDYEELQRQQAAAAAAEEARIAAEAAAAAAEAAAAAAEAAAALVPETPEAKRAKIAAEMAKAKAAYEAQMKALQEEEDMSLSAALPALKRRKMNKPQTDVIAFIKAMWRPGYRYVGDASSRVCSTWETSEVVAVTLQGEWDTESQALMGALILKAVANKEVRLKKGWTLQQLRLWIQEAQLPDDGAPLVEDRRMAVMPLIRLYRTYANYKDGTTMPLLNTPDGQWVMRLLNEAKQCMATYTQRRSPIQAPKAHLAHLPAPAPTNSPNTPAEPSAPRLPTVSLSPSRQPTAPLSPPRLPTAHLSPPRLPTAPPSPPRLPTAPSSPPRLPTAPPNPPRLPTARSSPAQSPTSKRAPSPQPPLLHAPILHQQPVLQPPHQQQPHPQQPHQQRPHPQQPRPQQPHPQQPHPQQPHRPNLWSPVGLAYEHVRAIPIRHLAKKGLSLYNVLGDGNCFFHASCVWQGTYHPQAHAEEREATAHFAENLVQLYQKLVAANQVPPDLPPLMSVLPHNQTEPIPLGLWYPAHLAKLGAWTHPNVLALYSLLRGIPLYLLDKGLSGERPWYTQGFTYRFGLSPEQVASCRPPGYKPGLDGEAMYMLLINNNHYMVLGRADGTRLRDGEVDLLQLAEEVNAAAAITTTELVQAGQLVAEPARGVDDSVPFDAAQVLKISRQCDVEAMRRLSPNSPYPHYLGTLEIDVAAARLTVEYGRERSFMICDIWMTCNLLKDDPNPVDYTRYARPTRHEDMWLKSRGFPQWSDVDALLLPLNISEQHWVLVVAYPKRGTLVLWDSLPVGCTLMYTNNISMLTAHWTLVNTTFPSDLLVVHVSLVQKPGGLDVWRWDRIRSWCSGVLGVSQWRYIIGAVDQQRDGNTCGDRIILAMEHLCRDMYMTRLTITEAEVAKLRPTLLKTLSAESGWTTLVAPYEEVFPDFASLPPPGPYVPDPNPTMIDLCTQEATPPLQFEPDLASVPPPMPNVPDPDASEVGLVTEEEETSLDHVMTIPDTQQDLSPEQPRAMPWNKVVDVFFTKEEQQAFPRAKTFAEQGLITEEQQKMWDQAMAEKEKLASGACSQDDGEAAPVPCSQDAAPIPCSQLDNPLKRPREQGEQLQAPSAGEKPCYPAIAGTGYFGSLVDYDDEALPPKPATADDSELTVTEELKHEEPTKAKAVKVAQDKGKGRGRGRGRGSRKGRGRGRGRGAGGDGSSMEEEEADAMDTQAEAVRGLNMAKATLNPADKLAKGRTTRVRSSKEALAEANTPPVTPKEVWAAPSHPLLEPEVLAVETKDTPTN
ncbi:hypothetical protein QJQ45_002767 [Haematococcus lacustris]|nr:hypothetical protein QJQ45_002767 [Haematococcus lacustris]